MYTDYDLANDHHVVILELTNKELRFLGQLIHMYLFDKQDSHLANQVLQSLVSQSDTVSKDPTTHKVFNGTDLTPPNAIRTCPSWIVPIEGI